MQITEKQFSTHLDIECQHCGANEMELVGTLRYVEFFIIPLFPLSKTYRMKCLKCHANTTEIEPCKETISLFQYISKFLGLLLVPIIISLYYLNENRQELEELGILTSPQAFDFYIVNLDKLKLTNKHQFPYSIAKVVTVNEQQVTFKLANYSYQTKRSLIKDIRSDTLLINNYFSTELHTLNKNYLLPYKADETILNAMRPMNLTLFGGLVVTPKELKG